MRKIYSFLPVFISLLVIAGCQSSAKVGTKEAFRFNLTPGKSYVYAMDMQMTQDYSGMKGTMNMKSDYLLNVLKEEANSKTVEVTYSDFIVDADITGLKMNVDTRKPQLEIDPKSAQFTDMFASIFYSMKDKKMEMTVSEEGKITSIKGVEVFKDAVFASLGVPNEMKTQLEGVFEQQFNEESMKKQFETAFFIFPGKSVSIGDKWSKDVEYSGIKCVNNYTVKSMEGEFITLAAESTMTGPNMKGNMTGTTIVEAATGLIINSEMEGDSDAGGMKMHMKVKVSGSAK